MTEPAAPFGNTGVQPGVVGTTIGDVVPVAVAVGAVVGVAVASIVGVVVGAVVGAALGDAVAVGAAVGITVGTTVGVAVADGDVLASGRARPDAKRPTIETAIALDVAHATGTATGVVDTVGPHATIDVAIIATVNPMGTARFIMPVSSAPGARSGSDKSISYLSCVSKV
jgi:hypothetical protein